MADYNIDIDVYKVFHFNDTTVTQGEIRKRYLKLSVKFHPDKIKTKRPINDEDNLRWADIQAANEILSNEARRGIYDSWRLKGDCGKCAEDANPPCGPCKDGRFQCPECSGVRPGSHKILKIWQGKPGVVFSKSSLRYFCRAACAATFKTRLGYTEAVHGYDTSDLNSGPPPPPKNPEKICPGCGQEKKFPDGADINLYKRINWVSLEENGEKCCSDYCLEVLLRRQKKNFTVCSQCNKVLKWNNNVGDWKKKKGTNNYFCSNDHLNKYYEGMEGGLGGGTDPLLNEKNIAIAAIDNALAENPPVNNNELETANRNWRQDIRNAADSTEITNIKNRVLVDIQNKRNAKKGDPLLPLKNNAIAEIDSELLQKPAIETQELEASNQNWGTAIQEATSESQINQIKNNVLADIKRKRQAKKQGGDDKGKSVDDLRQEAINQIRTELEKQPPVAKSELTNQDWEIDLAKAKTENAIKEIRDRVLAEIVSKRATKQEKNRLQELLTQAKQKENWDNYEKLEAILKQIKKLFSSDAYREKESEIQEVERRLQQLNPDKYKETQRNLLDQQMKDNGLTDSNMDEETKQALAAAKQDPTEEKIAFAGQKIAQNGANNKLNSLVTQISNQLKKGKLSKKEKANMLTKLLQFINKNHYQKNAYAKQKHTIDKLLAELQDEKSHDNTQNPPFWKKALVPLLVISLLGIMITGVLIWQRKKIRKIN